MGLSRSQQIYLTAHVVDVSVPSNQMGTAVWCMNFALTYDVCYGMQRQKAQQRPLHRVKHWMSRKGAYLV